MYVPPVKKRRLDLRNTFHKPTFQAPAFHDYHHHSHNQYAMETFHIANDAGLWSFGEDQTTVWSDTSGAAQPALEFNWGLDGPLGVSAVSSGIERLLTFRRHRTSTGILVLLWKT